MHDFSYLLGFREASGNFQQNDFGRGGTQGDPVDARSWPGAVFGTANMSHPIDGTSPVMNMGLVTSTNRHTAFDSTVVFHEFTHGISNRLVGGPLNSSALEAEQSGSMGEGWSDYMACTINNVTVLGNWILDNAGGIRGFPYDANFPDHFGNIGTGRYNEVHNVGEIWCATLMEMNRRTERHFAVQLVIDALKLTPANPNFLQARVSGVSSLISPSARTIGAGAASVRAYGSAVMPVRIVLWEAPTFKPAAGTMTWLWAGQRLLVRPTGAGVTSARACTLPGTLGRIAQQAAHMKTSAAEITN
jgi:hypothetical protein